MSSSQFWALPLKEFLYAVDGYAASRGVKKGSAAAAKPMSRSRLLELAGQYPDTPREPALAL